MERDKKKFINDLWMIFFFFFWVEVSFGKCNGWYYIDFMHVIQGFGISVL